MKTSSSSDAQYSGYQKIPLSSTDWKTFPKDKKMKWYVTEKVHGSCFCFIIDPSTHMIQYAKRNKLIQPDEHFFGYHTILSDIEPKIHLICDAVVCRNMQSIPKKVLIYGELFGGCYPGMSSTYKPIQGGIYYSPNIHFYAFDISIQTSNGSEEREEYIDYSQSIEIFDSVGILYAAPLATYASFDKAIQYKLGFNSTIPYQLGLRDDIGVNKAEGIVIRSSKGHYLMKMKIDEFSESKYDENEYQHDDNEVDELTRYKRLCLLHLTKNRMNNAMSKVGEYESYDEEIYECLVDDILLEVNGFHVYGLREWLLHEAYTQLKK